MAVGKRKPAFQRELFVLAEELPTTAAHPFYAKVNDLLEKNGFDRFAQERCASFYASRLGRPGLPPGNYFRLMMIGYFEGIASERGIAWRVADSLALRHFLGLALTEPTPDHSTISKTRRLISLETHHEVFSWVLELLAREKILVGKTIGVDATTLEANAAMRGIIRRDTGEPYPEFLEKLAKAAGVDTQSREDLARFDRKRKKKTSNKDWKSPVDPDSRVARMKSGSTHLAHKIEHAVDMDSGAVVGVTVQGADLGDTTTVHETVRESIFGLGSASGPKGNPDLRRNVLTEIVTDKGYNSSAAILDLSIFGLRTYIPEPERGTRDWTGKDAERDATSANRRRIRGKRGQALLRKRGEQVERSFAHCYETGGMRRLFLRGRENIKKRLLIHLAGFNFSLIMRKLFGKGTPRGWADFFCQILLQIVMFFRWFQRNFSRTHVSPQFLAAP